MRLLHRTGQFSALLGCISFASAAVYWFTGMVLSTNQLAVYNALVAMVVGTLLLGIGVNLIDNPSENT